MNNAPILQGLRVVEASAFVAAPLGGMTLAQLGADVIRIDPLHGGLDQHRWPVNADNVSLFWCGLNKHKRSVALDLGSPEGRELASAIVCAPGDDGGLFITNFPPRGWLDHASLRARRADLIQLTLTGDRHGGSAVDYTVNARVGFPFITGAQGAAEVVNHVLPAWDLITGQTIALGLLAAERQRRRSGTGQHIRLALEDVALAVMGHLGYIAEAQLGQERARIGNDLFGAFGRDFACADGERVMVVGLTGKQWRALCDATASADAMSRIGRELGLDLAQEGNRFRARDAIGQVVGAWIAQHAFADVAAQFDRHGVCWGRYQSVMQLVQRDPSCSVANPMFATVEQPGVGELLVPSTPLDFSDAPRVAPKPAPRLGEHTEQVLHELLGIDGAAFGRLHDRGVVASPAASR